MAEDMHFLPRSKVLSIEEMLRVAQLFTELGVTKIRVTGGEPLIRKGVDTLMEGLGQLDGLRELAITTNGSQLASKSESLRLAGVSSVNISIDSLQRERFRTITRIGALDKVLNGIQSAIESGFPKIRLNAVIMDGFNRDEVLPLLDFAIQNKISIAFIEEMPLGQVNIAGKSLAFVASDELIDEVSLHHSLEPAASAETAGPAREFFVRGTKTRIGFISPHTNNFCATCNRLRVTAEGRLLLCLGNEHSLDLRKIIRGNASDETIKSAIIAAVGFKPERHVFDQPDRPQIMRFMNATGG